ncbi:MAG TPA: lactate racemase domain-containing protein [Acidimicrobiales bacterium]|nr:lactate racemase domain-containing protein [Acidimicrobiales bacterium]
MSQVPAALEQVVSATAEPGQALGYDEIAGVLAAALEDAVAGERVLVLVPDRTRNLPLAELFPVVQAALHRAARVDVMVALGTHPAMAESDIRDLIGLPEGGLGSLATISNHDWSNPSVLRAIGTVSGERLQEVAGATWHSSLGGDLIVRVNKAAVEADRVVIVGPTLPHEVAGYSSGAKYLFPGISGPEMIDVMHWLAALSGILATIGVKETPVRALIRQAASFLGTPVSNVALVTDGTGGGDNIAGIYAGDLEGAWSASVAQAERLHTAWVDRPYNRVISCAMPIYSELWTAGKAMYKLEPVVADGGELVIYAPHLSTVSLVHGEDIFAVGYHVLAYFLEQWDRFSHAPLAVLAHSTHVKGAGTFDVTTRTEYPRIEVKLASQISLEDCARLNLGYVDPRSVDLSAGNGAGGSDGPGGGTLVVPRSGEMLYRVKTSTL